jgi:hypothetical protein
MLDAAHICVKKLSKPPEPSWATSMSLWRGRNVHLGFAAAALSGFPLCFDVLFHGGHGACLRSVAGLPLRHVLPYFLLSFAGHLRYTWALTASAIPAPFSARLMHG